MVACNWRSRLDQGARGFGVAGVEFANLRVQQVEEIKGRAGGGVGGRAGGCKAAAMLGLGPGHDGPADRLGVGEDAGLDGFVLAGGGHACYVVVNPQLVHLLACLSKCTAGNPTMSTCLARVIATYASRRSSEF